MNYMHITLPLENPRNTLERLLGEIVHQKDMAHLATTTGDSNRHEWAVNQIKFEVLRRFQELEQQKETTKKLLQELDFPTLIKELVRLYPADPFSENLPAQSV